MLRKVFAEYPGVTTAMSVALLLIALAVVGFQLLSRSDSTSPREPPGEPREAGEPEAHVRIDGETRDAGALAGAVGIRVHELQEWRSHGGLPQANSAPPRHSRHSWT